MPAATFLEAPTVFQAVPDTDVSPLTVAATGGALGAIVTGLNARRPLPPEIVFRLKQALNDHHVLIFKDQDVSEAELVAFATHFAPLFVPPADVPVLGSAEGSPTVVTIANTEGGLLGNRELTAHIDHHWTPYPSSGSLLYALEVPSQGGDTHWTNLVQAYEALDPATKARIADLRLRVYNPFVRRPGLGGTTYRVAADDPPEEAVYAHPLVRTHPESGRKILYLNESNDVELIGVDPQEGAALIARLRIHLRQPEFVYPHRWSVGDIVYWDNQATQHYRPAFDASERRVMRRVSLAGSRPF